MNDRNVHDEVEAKDAEMLKQQELGREEMEADEDDDGLSAYDRADADSFPASDPPEAAEAETPDDIDRAASAGITGVRPHDD